MLSPVRMGPLIYHSTFTSRATIIPPSFRNNKIASRMRLNDFPAKKFSQMLPTVYFFFLINIIILLCKCDHNLGLRMKREKFQSENLNIEIFSEKSPHATRIVAELGDAAWYGVCTQKEWISSLRSGRKILWLDARDLLPLACTVRQFNKLPPVCSHPSCSSSRIQSGNDFSGYVEKEKRSIVDACSRKRRLFLKRRSSSFFFSWNKYVYINFL